MPEICYVQETPEQIATGWLEQWYAWEIGGQRAGTKYVAAGCTNAVSSRQWESTYDIASSQSFIADMRAVGECMNALDIGMRAAINCELRNRFVRARVWSKPWGGKSFADALQQIIPLMRQRGLL